MDKSLLTIELLKRSVKEWNETRKAHPEIQANLSGANLYRANLSNADLSEANLTWANLVDADLSGANLSGANFSGANFRGADLSGATLRGADLREANLSGATLSYADLSGAGLSGADLRFANLYRANLIMVNFGGAIIGGTVFADVDLSDVKGRDTVRHRGPSEISISTLYNSKGNIPELFLRGCGVPDTFIDYVRSLTGSTIEYYSCFISYSHNDEAFAKRLWEGLQTKGIRCWYAPHDMKIGDKIRPVIDESIRVHDKLLLILSEHSVQSDWVEHEVEHALDLEKTRKKNVLFPVRLDDAVMNSSTGWAGNVRRQRHIGNFTQWKDHDAYTTSFDRLLRDLMAENQACDVTLVPSTP